MRLNLEFEGRTYRVPIGFWWRWRRPQIKRRVRHFLLWPFEWFGILLGIAVLSSLPYRALLAVCDFLALVYYLFDRRGRATAGKNLAIMFPGNRKIEKSKNRKRILRRSYRNMTRSIGYAFWTFRAALKRCTAAGELSAECKAYLAANRPAVTVSGHLGCWEILSQLALLEGHAMMSVAKDVGTPGMTRMLMRARRSIGQEIVSAAGAFKTLMAGIRSGKSLGLLVDQVVTPKDGGIPVRFFGRDYHVSPAPAFFAAKAKAPILVAWSRPLRNGRYRCEFLEAVSSEAARDMRTTTQRIATDLERIIRRHPSCWPLNYDCFRPVWTREQEGKRDELLRGILRQYEG